MATWLLVYGRRQFLERFPAHQAHGLQQHYYYSHVPHATFIFYYTSTHVVVATATATWPSVWPTAAHLARVAFTLAYNKVRHRSETSLSPLHKVKIKTLS